MVDEVRVLRLLRGVSDDVATLRVEASADELRRVDSMWLARSMRKAVGFRNILVHEYAEVDDAVVIDRLSDLSDLEAFVRALTGYVERSS